MSNLIKALAMIVIVIISIAAAITITHYGAHGSFPALVQ